MSEINWSMKDKNPIDSVGFFDSFDDTTKRPVHAHQITSMMPNMFQACAVRVRVRLCVCGAEVVEGFKVCP